MNWIVDIFIFLIFFSKVSFKSLLPSEFSYVIFQHGLHPALNLGVHALLFTPFLWLYLKNRQEFKLSRSYLTTVLFVGLCLISVTVLQIDTSDWNSWMVSAASLLFSLLLLGVFGVMLPQIQSRDFFLRRLFFWSLLFVVASALLGLLSHDLSFKGGRFIGVFKHIPFMVTTATVCFFTSLYLQSQQKKWSKLPYAIAAALSFGLLVLTGTRSATFICVLMAGILVYQAFRKSPAQSALRWSCIALFAIFLGYFSGEIVSSASDIVQGKKSFAYREAQNGLADRWDELSRGLAYSMVNPWLGQGLGFKYMNAQEGLSADLNYNSHKDPHNYLISALVVGGYPLLVVCLLLLIYLTVKTIRGVILYFRKHESLSSFHALNFFVFLNLPILVIYHVHFSLGGMADRIYWLAFGLIAQEWTRRYYNKPDRSFGYKRTTVEVTR